MIPNQLSACFSIIIIGLTGLIKDEVISVEINGNINNNNNNNNNRDQSNINSGINVREIISAKCYSKCLQIFIRYKHLSARPRNWRASKNSTEQIKVNSNRLVATANMTTTTVKQLLSTNRATNTLRQQNQQQYYIESPRSELLAEVKFHLSLIIPPATSAEADAIDKKSQHFLLNQCLTDYQNLCSQKCIKTCTSLNEYDDGTGDETVSNRLDRGTVRHICRNKCQKSDIGCWMGCAFTMHFSAARNEDDVDTGCPIEQQPQLQAKSTSCSSLSATPCLSKLDCAKTQICCFVKGCGKFCLSPKVKRLPSYTPYPVGKSTTSIIEFDWSRTFRPYLDGNAPLVFILQIKACLCKRFIDKYATSWSTILMTQKLGAQLSSLVNGTVYRFRVAAINVHTDIRQPLKFGNDSPDLPHTIYWPQLPASPEKLRDQKWSTDSAGKFSVHLRWDRPIKSIWNNVEYLINWTIDHNTPSHDGDRISSYTQYSKTIPMSALSYTITGLQPDTTYKIAAISRAVWPGFGFIDSSSAAIFYLTTPTINTAEKAIDDNNISGGGGTAVDIRARRKNGFSADIESGCVCQEQQVGFAKVQEVSVLNGYPQVILDMGEYGNFLVDVYPEVCIGYSIRQSVSDDDRMTKLYKSTAQITLTNLRHSCRYSAKVVRHTRSIQGVRSTKPPFTFCFCTPKCSDSYHLNNCPSKDNNHVPPPSHPRFNIDDIQTMTYLVSWRPPSLAASYISSTSVLGDAIVQSRYRISWAPSRLEPISVQYYQAGVFSPLLETDQLDVKVVGSNTTKLLLRNLTKERLYIVQIQSLFLQRNGKFLESAPTVLYLKTVGFKNFEIPALSSSSDTVKVNVLLQSLMLLLLLLMSLSFQSFNSDETLTSFLNPKS